MRRQFNPMPFIQTRENSIIYLTYAADFREIDLKYLIWIVH